MSSHTSTAQDGSAGHPSKIGARLRRGLRSLGLAAGVFVGLLFALHEALTIATKIEPPKTSTDSRGNLPRAAAVAENGGIRRLGPAYARKRGGVREVYLQGTPEEIGNQQVRLNYDLMVDNERSLWNDFIRYVPFWPARTAIMDLSRVRYRHVDRGFPESRRREVASQAEAFRPDPFDDELPTYQRMVFLNALYDIALSFEHSPLIGCSTFMLGPGATRDSHTLLARAFDFEAGDVFDRSKAVFFVREAGGIPFASVAWPGFIGVMSGMNAEGVAVVVHGARAREPVAEGEPVAFMLRDVLEKAHDTAEAVAVLAAQDVMVSHIVIVADANGHFAVVERAPGVPAFSRETFADPDRVGVTNHFEGPLRDDPKNLAVQARTSSVARRARLDELLARIGPHEADARRAVAMLRDHECSGGVSCELGDRRSIDALIATHGIVADTTARVLWVSAGPHLSGHFTRFDLKAIFAEGHAPESDVTTELIPDDPILHDGRYEAGRTHAGQARLGGDEGGSRK
jgi:isopenicillin-N N-acyltransferase-like protein